MLVIRFRAFHLSLFALILPIHILAQQPRLIQEANLGIEFRAPEGWQYQQNDIGYIFGHNTIAGIIIVTTSPNKSINELKKAAKLGIQDEGTSLHLSGEVNLFGKQGLEGIYKGIMDGQEVKAFMIGLINNIGGEGVSCMIITTPNMFTNEHQIILRTMASSIKFSEPKVADVVKEWEEWFKTPGGCRLKYLTSSGGSDYTGGYSGGSSEETIDLCPNGDFGFSSSNSYSSSFDAGSAYVAGSGGGQGVWNLKFNGTNPVLVLNFNDGSTNEYELTYIDSKTYLNDYRYFVLFEDEGPRCY